VSLGVARFGLYPFWRFAADAAFCRIARIPRPQVASPGFSGAAREVRRAPIRSFVALFAESEEQSPTRLYQHR
jgi:hypothetical protein